MFYQSSLILTELFQHNLMNVSYLTACYLYQVMMTLHFLNDVANDAESTQKIKNYTIIASTIGNTRFASFDIKFTRLGFENAC